MNSSKFIITLLLSFFVFTACSLVDKLKEKISSKKEELTEKESTKESTKENSAENMEFYNKYIGALNKIQDAGDDVYSDYMSNIPEPSSINKNSLIIPVSFQLSVSTLERVTKEYRRSLLDKGELSKLSASGEMQDEVETSFKKLLTTLDQYYAVSSKVSEYYSKYKYKEDLSKVKPYDEEIKAEYEKYKTDIDNLSDILKKYKPKREVKDPSSIKNPNEKASTIMLNAYGNILDGAEEFYDNFKGLKMNDDVLKAKQSLDNFERIYNESKESVLNAEFTESTRFMKYTFEDYFQKTVNDFLTAGREYFEKNITSDSDYRKKYNEVINKYNLMINSYNTNINSINMIRSF